MTLYIHHAHTQESAQTYPRALLTHHTVIYGIVAPTSPFRFPTCQKNRLSHCKSLAPRSKLLNTKHSSFCIPPAQPRTNNTYRRFCMLRTRQPLCNFGWTRRKFAHVATLWMQIKTGSGLEKSTRCVLGPCMCGFLDSLVGSSAVV
jgi:hypothetical protein